jgi:hypothetical protein
MLLSRMTPVVVSSVPPMISGISSCRFENTMVTRSAPSSIVIAGRVSSAQLR